MKKILALSVCLFLTGFLLKFLHVHYHTYIMVVGLLLMLVVFTIFAFKKNSDIDSILGFASISWLILLFFTIKYLPFPTIVLTIAFILTVIALVVTHRKKLTGQKLVLGFSIILSLSFYFMPKDSRYYILNIRWNHEINKDYETWDKYSWHLYHNHKYEESIKASDKALQIVTQSGNSEWIDFVTFHNSKIREKNWTNYR